MDMRGRRGCCKGLDNGKTYSVSTNTRMHSIIAAGILDNSIRLKTSPPPVVLRSHANSP